LGRFLAEHYLTHGDTVVGCSRSAGTIEHASYVHHQLDVTDESAVAKLFGDVRQRLNGLDVLINNAGAASMNAFMLTPVSSIRRILDINFVGAAILAHGAVRLLRRSEAARIVNVTTIAVPLRLEGEAIYAASKSAVETFTRILAREIGPMGITCNAVGPSVISTQLTQGVPPEKLNRLIRGQSVPRQATAADVANVVDFFLKPESGLITGQIVYLGGYG
jgi:3-oxoacyl-[acyl-carrier protein] reductase